MTLKEMVNYMLVYSESPQNLWGKALLTANQIIPQKLSLISFELWHEMPPFYCYLKI